MTPSPEADPITLLRRLHTDLTGLPPTPEEVDAFVAGEETYEAAVDRLLASPHFGERWARHWLDKARYADTDGYEKDETRREAWRFRDWVVDAINADLPFDRFTIEQLAGDLLPDATTDTRVATAFHRQTLTNKEGGVDPEEFREFARGQIAHYKVPRFVWIVDEFPTTVTGKIQKFRIREIAAERLARSKAPDSFR